MVGSLISFQTKALFLSFWIESACYTYFFCIELTNDFQNILWLVPWIDYNQYIWIFSFVCLGFLQLVSVHFVSDLSENTVGS